MVTVQQPMLKKLKYTFVFIIIILVEAVLIAHTGLSMYLTYKNQQDRIAFHLTRILAGEEPSNEEFGKMPHHHSDMTDASNMLSYLVTLDERGNIKPSPHTRKYIGKTSIVELSNKIIASKLDKGSMRDYHVSWMRSNNKIAFIDTSAFDFAFSHSIVMISCMIAGTLVIISGIAWALSGWAIKPIEEAARRQHMFLSDASHELKTPLSVIIANSDILLASRTLDAGERKWIQSTSDEAKHLKQMVNDLLELARSDEAAAGTLNILQMDDVDFSDVVNEAVLEFDTVAFEQGCSILAHVEDSVHVMGDKSLLTRLVTIFIDNACKYARAHTQILVTLAREQKQLRFQINNQGDVLTHEEQKHIFDRFYRSDKARSREAGKGGFGLGLAIAQGIVLSHKGAVSVTSTLQEGTTFTVTIPLKQK